MGAEVQRGIVCASDEQFVDNRNEWRVGMCEWKIIDGWKGVENV